MRFFFPVSQRKSPEKIGLPLLVCMLCAGGVLAQAPHLSKERLAEILRYQNDLARSIVMEAVIKTQDLLERETKETRCRLIISGKRFRYEKTEWNPFEERMETRVLTYDGSRSAKYTIESLDGDLYEGLSIGRGEEVYIAEIAWYPLPQDYSEPSKTGAIFPVALMESEHLEVFSDVMNGKECVKVVFHGMETWWLSKTEGYRPARMEFPFDDRNEGLLWEVELKQIEGDFWFPIRGIRKRLAKKTGKPIEIKEFEIQSITINQDIEEKSFVPAFPRGHRVYDHSVNAGYVVGGVDASIEAGILNLDHIPTAPRNAIAQAGLERIKQTVESKDVSTTSTGKLARPEAPNSPPRRKLIYPIAACAAAAVLLIALAVWKRTRKSQ